MNGLRKRPLWIRLASLFLWANTLGMPVQIVVLFGQSPSEWTAIWAKLTAQNKLVMALSPFAALGVQRVTRWGWVAAMAFLAAALLNNVVLLGFPASPVPRLWVGMATALLAVATFWLLRPSTVRLFRRADLHWWKPAPRYQARGPVELESGEGGWVTTRLYNISSTGLFVEAPRSALKPGDVVGIRVRLRDRWIRGRASVVRYATWSTSYPEGFGLRFCGVPLTDRIWLHRRLKVAAAV